MAGSTLTKSTTSLAATRGRPFSFDLNLTSTSQGEALDVTGVTVSALMTWPGVRRVGTVDRTRVPWTISWSGSDLHNVPTDHVQLLVTISEADGSIHDLLFPIAVSVVPLPDSMVSQ